MKIFCIILAVFTAGAIIVTLSSFIQNDLRQQLVGDWQNVYLKVRLNIYDSSPVPQVMEADSTNWEARLGIKPIRTHFDSNGTYNSVYKKLPFWNMINGSISDCLWHIGQVVTFRRSSGNPFSAKVEVFLGKIMD